MVCHQQEQWAATPGDGIAEDDVSADLDYESEQTPQEYLRSHGLSLPFEEVFTWPDDGLVEPSKLRSVTDDAVDPWDELARVMLPNTVTEDEDLDVSIESTAFLQDLCHETTDAEAEHLADHLKADTMLERMRELKLELPILRSDNVLDLREYKRTVQEARAVDLSKHNLPQEPCDIELDEGLEFPSWAYEADARIIGEVRNEKLDFSLESLKALSKQLNSDWTDDNREALLQESIGYKGLVLRKPLTPPISPRPRPYEPSVPDISGCALPMLSAKGDDVDDDLKRAEDQILGFDNEGWMTMAEIDALLDLEEVDASDLVAHGYHGLKNDALKLEEPLLLRREEHLISPDLKGACESIQSMHRRPHESQVEALNESAIKAKDETLEAILKDNADTLMRTIEQEQLVPLDAILHVDVPVLDFSVPKPEWEEFCDSPSRMFEHVMKTTHANVHRPKWPWSKTEESKMIWSFWTAPDPQPWIEEPIGDQAALDKFLDGGHDDDVPATFDFIFKKPGLRILDQDDDDDEELLPRDTSSRQQADLATMIQKRRRSSDEEMAPEGHRTASSRVEERQGVQDVIGSLLDPNEVGAASRLLDNYMEMNAPKKRKLEASKYFSKPAAPVATKTAAVSFARPTRPTERDKESAHHATSQKLMSCPDNTPSEKPPRLIIAVTLPRGLISRLEQLLPGVQLLDRDYNAHNNAVWMPGTVRRAEVTSPMAQEADLTVSPSTGIVLTTMVKMRQKPPPGVQGQSGLRTRIETVSAKYERVVVLVSEDNKIDESMSDLSPTDAAALNSFHEFAAALPAEMQIFYVGGGSETQAKWVAAIASQHAAGNIDSQKYLVQEETPWELFLRRAGMNVYAAQVVLGMLRRSPDVPINSGMVFGLPAFVAMTDVQRFDMFERVLGGRGVLSQVGRILNSNWGDQNWE